VADAVFPDLIRVKIPRWGDFNPRDDLKKPSWYRQDAKFLFDPEFIAWGPRVRLTWIAMLCLRTPHVLPKGTPLGDVEFNFSIKLVAIALEFTAAEVYAAALVLQRAGHIKIVRTICAQDQHAPWPDPVRDLAESRTDPVQDPAAICTDAGRDPDEPRSDPDEKRSLRDGTGRDGDVIPIRYEISPRASRSQPEADPEDVAIAESWGQYAREVSRTVKVDLQAWTRAARQLRELDGLSHDELRALLAFVREDPFWRDKAASLPGLRIRSPNGLRKVENAQAAMATAAASARPEDPQRDHAIRLADQALTVVMGPLNALPWSARSLDESGAYLREHISAEALEVFGETSENWRTWFRSTRNSVERGGLPAARAQLRDSILAVMRRRDAAQVEAPVDAAPSPPPDEPPPDEPPPDEPPPEVDEVSLIEAANNAVEKVIVAAYTPPERKSDLRLTLPLAAFQAVDELAGSDWRAYLADVRQRYEQNPFDDIGLEKLRETILGKLQGGEP